MNIAVIGAGLAGLSLAWHLVSSSHKVVVFDAKGIGAGASGVASGLLHPFPASASKLSFMGYEAFHEALCLIRLAEKFSTDPIYSDKGIFKLAYLDDQKKLYSSIGSRYVRTSWKSAIDVQKHVYCTHSYPALFIENGVTVYCGAYLNALWKASQSKGALFVQESISDMKSLSGFDKVILCTGAGIKGFDPLLPIQYVKGQILTCLSEELLTDVSFIAKGYVAVTNTQNVYHIGSTYEHHFKDEKVDVEYAKREILEQPHIFNEKLKKVSVLECRSGIRVMNPRGYLPIVKKYSSNLYAITGLGSRGLLYHGLLGRQLAEAMHANDDKRISREFFIGER